jgi:hypothetical protein
MKKNFTISLLLIILLAGSCQDDQDTIPTSLIGTWELTSFNDYMGLDFVTTYKFNADRTYEYSSTLREKDTTLDLGYNFWEKGTFSVEHNTVNFTLTEFLHKPYSGDKPFYSIEELIS